MSTFFYSIKTSFILFPLVAFFFTLPYMIRQYHKYGSINSYRSIIIYSFLLYLMSAYFLVILPLPSIESVSSMTNPAYNLQPFHFISEILHKTNFHVSDFATYFPTLKNPVVYEAFFNILLTLPFGVYLHYYFKCNFKQTFFYSLCFSLFFELTQLSGLYFIYPRSYRVFDVDDLILNTFGGVVGYFFGSLFLKFLPSRDDIDKVSLEKGKNVSFLRRSLAFFLDLLLFLFFFLAILFLLKERLTVLLFVVCYLFISFMYFVLFPILLKGRTLGMKYLKLRFFSSKDSIKWYQYFLYYFTLVFEYIVLPFIMLFIGFILWKKNIFSGEIYHYYFISILFFLFMTLIISLLKRIFKMNFFYESISRLKVESTIISK